MLRHRCRRRWLIIAIAAMSVLVLLVILLASSSLSFSRDAPAPTPPPRQVYAHMWVKMPSLGASAVIVRRLQALGLLLTNSTFRITNGGLDLRITTKNEDFAAALHQVSLYHAYSAPVLSSTTTYTPLDFAEQHERDATNIGSGGIHSSSSSSSREVTCTLPPASSFRVVDVNDSQFLPCPSLPGAARGGNMGCVGALAPGAQMFQNIINGSNVKKLKMATVELPDDSGRKDLFWLNIGEKAADGVDKYGRTALMWAAARGDADMTEFLLEHVGSDPNQQTAHVLWQDLNGNTPLMLGVWGGNEQVVEDLLQAGAKVDLKSPQGQTALHWAGRFGRTAIAEKLVEVGARVDVVDREGWSPLHWAAEYGRAGAARLFLDHGAAPWLQSKHGLSPLHLAASMGKSRSMDEWRNKKTIEDFTIANGNDGGHASVVKLLLRRLLAAAPAAGGGDNGERSSSAIVAASVNAVDINGRTPLHVAAEFGTVETVSALLKRGGIVKAFDSAKMSPLHYAVRRGNSKGVVKLLIDAAGPADAGSIILAADADGLSVLDMAQRHRRRDLLPLLREAAHEEHIAE